MKVATTAPVPVKSPVRITDEKYAMWYARPVNLGEITKQGNYWYTSDGMRFMSSRNALDYLIKIRELVEAEIGIDTKYAEKVQTTRSVAKPAAVMKSKPKRQLGANKKSDKEAFERFLQTMGYVKKDEKGATQ